jgi:hypothetical protein
MRQVNLPSSIAARAISASVSLSPNAFLVFVILFQSVHR